MYNGFYCIKRPRGTSMHTFTQLFSWLSTLPGMIAAMIVGFAIQMAPFSAGLVVYKWSVFGFLILPLITGLIYPASIALGVAVRWQKLGTSGRSAQWKKISPWTSGHGSAMSVTLAALCILCTIFITAGANVKMM